MHCLHLVISQELNAGSICFIHHHKALANFLDRRGFPEISIQLPDLFLETMIDFSLRYGFTDYLINAIEIHGVKNFHMIYYGRGVSGDGR